MKLKFWMLAMTLALATWVRGATNDLTGLLQKGLFEEEANRDLTAAIANYQSLANAFDKDRQLAATAIFRLGECYRKLGKTNEATAQYQRIIKEFSDQQTLVTLSQQNLAGLSAASKPATAGANEASLLDAEANVASLQAQIEEIKKMPGDQERIYVEQNFPNPVLTTLVQELDLAQQNLIKLKSDYTPDHPKYKNAQELVEDLNQKIDAQIEGVLLGLQSKLSVAQAQLNLLRNHEGDEASGVGAGGSAVLLRLQIERERQQIADFQNHEQELLKLYLPDNSRVRDVRRQIDSENAKLAVLIEKLKTSQGAIAEGGNSITDEEQQEIRRIQGMIQNSPDLINAPGGEGLGYTPLIQAAEKGQLVVAKYLLDHGADVNSVSRKGFYSPLSAAAQNGHKAMVELLLSRGAAVNGRGLNPLLEAVNRGYVAVAEVLLEHKADVNTYSMTKPIHVAVQNGKIDLLQLLLQHGAEVNVTNEEGRSPLEFAAIQNDTNAATLLLAAKASVESRDKEGDTPLHRAAEHRSTEMVSLLIASGAVVDSTNYADTAPLWFAVWNRNPAATRVLLEHKADPNRLGIYPNGQPSPRKFPPVAAAIWQGNRETLKLLLDAGADPEGGSWASPLNDAVSRNNEDAVQLLLDHGANPNRVVNGFPPVNLVLKSSRNPKIVSLLLDKGADANATDTEGYTPLLRTTDSEVGRWLVEHKANVNQAGPYGITPLKNAVAVNNTNDLKFLLDAGAKPDLQDTNGNTALHDAVYYSATEAVALLLAHKADPNVQNNLGYTPLDLAKVGVEGHSFSTMLNPGPSGQGQISTDVMRKISQLLTDAGGLANLPKRNRIEVRRASESGVVFTKGSREWNRYSLLEMIAGEYHLVEQSVSGEWRQNGGTRSSVWNNGLRFPDFKNVIVYRRTDMSARQKAININVEDILNSGDCSRDSWLEWGDVIEIPETDHPVDSRWGGLSKETVTALTNCLARQVTVNIKGISTPLKLMPEVKSESPNGEMLELTHVSFMLRSVLDNSKLVRVSSDLSRVKVTRIDPETKKKVEWTIDCTNPTQADLWLRDGDVIEIPEK